MFTIIWPGVSPFQLVPHLSATFQEPPILWELWAIVPLAFFLLLFSYLYDSIHVNNYDVRKVPFSVAHLLHEPMISRWNKSGFICFRKSLDIYLLIQMLSHLVIHYNLEPTVKNSHTLKKFV